MLNHLVVPRALHVYTFVHTQHTYRASVSCRWSKYPHVYLHMYLHSYLNSYQETLAQSICLLSLVEMSLSLVMVMVDMVKLILNLDGVHLRSVVLLITGIDTDTDNDADT